MAAQIRAITISQPYASLIASGEKWIENRTWSTDYRGPLAIHAGKGTQYLTRSDLASYPTGCVLAVAELVACMPLASMRQMRATIRIPAAGITLGDVLAHEHCEGPWCWILRDIRRLKTPVPCSGQRGIWPWQCELADLEAVQ